MRGRPVADGEVVRPGLRDGDLVTCRDLAGLDHPQVGTGNAVLGEPAHPVGLVDEPGEHRARNAHVGHLEQAATHPPALADAGTLHVEADGGQVLAEGAGCQRTAELGLPVGVVLAGEGVDGLVDAAVVLEVGDLVTVDTEGLDAHRPGDGALVDGRPLQHAVLAGTGLSPVDRFQNRHAPTLAGARPKLRDKSAPGCRRGGRSDRLAPAGCRFVPFRAGRGEGSHH